MHISIIDDEKILNNKIVKKLESNGYTASGFLSYKEFLQYGNHLSDLYIVDVSLGDGSGFEVVRFLRKKWCTSPILMLSWYGDSENIIYGLNIGADDYMTKPFIPDELIARIHALLRRPKNLQDQNCIEYKWLTLLPMSGKAALHGSPIQLSRKEFFFLEILLMNRGNFVERDVLVTKVWWSPELDEISNNNINVISSRLRKKIGPDLVIESGTNKAYRIL